MRPKGFCGNEFSDFRKRAYLLRAVKATRKTLDAIICIQSGFLIEVTIDEKTGLPLAYRAQPLKRINACGVPVAPLKFDSIPAYRFH